MSRQLITSNSSFEHQISYSRAVVSGDFVFVSGTTGYDYNTSTLPTSVEDQCEQIFENINAALNKADCSMKDIVRIHYLLPDRNDFEKCWPVIRMWLGEVRPAATMMQVGLMKEEMKIEIEVTAHKLGNSTLYNPDWISGQEN